MKRVSLTRGYVLAASLRYVEVSYDEPVQKQFLGLLSRETREHAPYVDKLKWYPVAQASDVFRAVVDLHDRDDLASRRALARLGMFLGEAATQSYLRLVSRFLTPALFARKLPEFWARDYVGGNLVVESLIDKKVIAFHHHGIEGFDYLSGVYGGFLEHCLKLVGVGNARVETEGFSLEKPGPDEALYTARWD
ncbi:hypothetical protein BH09MYX1_BH09MYX1_64270 [soil metagenome]